MGSNTETNIAWYYVGVLALMLFGQNYLLNTAHKEAVAKLAAKAPASIVATSAPAAAVAAPAPAAAAAVTAPVVAQATAPAAAAPVPAPVSTLKASPATEKKEAPKTIVASPAPKATGKALPVRVAYRTEPFRKGKVVTLTNTSTAKVAMTLNVSRPGTGETQSFPLTLAPSAETRVIGTKDWSFKPGDQIELAQAGYRPTTTSVP